MNDCRHLAGTRDRRQRQCASSVRNGSVAPSSGFLRVRCEGCAFERLIPFLASRGRCTPAVVSPEHRGPRGRANDRARPARGVRGVFAWRFWLDPRRSTGVLSRKEVFMKAALLWTILLVPFIAYPAGAVDITACGQLVPDGQIGVLQVDLDCGGAFNTCFADPALACAKDPACTDTGCGGLMLRNGATLAMNGHTVANGIVLCPYGVSRHCSVVGPGIVAGRYGLFAQINLSASGGLDVHGGQSGIVALTV